MITKTFKWICNKNLNINKIGCLICDGEIAAFTYLDDDDDLSEIESSELYCLDDNEHIFETRDEALAFRDHLKQTYISKLKEVAPIIDALGYDKEEIDPSQYIEALKPQSSYYSDRYNHTSKINKLLVMVIRTGFICINAENVKVSEVVNVEWHKKGGEGNDRDYAVLETKGGNKNKTCNEAEFDAVEIIFGQNTSGMYYQN